jgi:exodeoxyribonuclease VII small subunit
VTFEEAFERLENITNRLEKGEHSLNESMKAFEEGMSLIRICLEQIDKAETKLKTLMKDADGHFQLETMESDE